PLGPHDRLHAVPERLQRSERHPDRRPAHHGRGTRARAADEDRDAAGGVHGPAIGFKVGARPKGSEAMAFELPDLPYAYDALEPHIDEETMHLHHDKHHQAYVDNANKALGGTEWESRSIADILTSIEILPDDIRAAVRNNLGGHANHS